jgi:hypothetical protein
MWHLVLPIVEHKELLQRKYLFLSVNATEGLYSMSSSQPASQPARQPAEEHKVATNYHSSIALQYAEF